MVKCALRERKILTWVCGYESIVSQSMKEDHMKQQFEDTVNLDKDKFKLTPTKDGANVVIDTGYAKFSVQLSQNELAVLMRDSLNMKDVEKAREAKMQRELGDNKIFRGHQL